MTAQVAWGLCATVKAPQDQLLAFIAHHLGLGAAHIWIFLDEPDDPAFDAIAGIDRVTATRCDMAYWKGLINKRPDRHQNRQGRNIQSVYNATTLPWVGHIDVDEYLLPSEDIGAVLARMPDDRPMYRMAPWEALHDPALPDDIFTARQFRAALPGADKAGARERIFGPFAPLLAQGVLSHSAGKCFFRTGLSRFEPRLHGAFRAGERVKGGDFGTEIALLHFHAEDPARWKDRLQFRLERGAYSFNEALRTWLMAAGPAGVDGFYDAVQRASPDLLARLQAEGALLTADLGLRAKVAALTGTA